MEPSAKEAILCVDDEAIILMHLTMILRNRYGGRFLYEKAANAEIALKSLDRLFGDGVRVAGLSALYPKLVQVLEKYYDVEMSAFTRDPGLKVRGWKDLEGLSVGYILGWKIYEENVQGPKVVKVKDSESLFRMLGQGRLDVALLQKLDGLALAKELGIGDARALEPPLAVMPHYLYLNEKDADLVPKLAAELARMKRDGRYDAIVAKVMKL